MSSQSLPVASSRLDIQGILGIDSDVRPGNLPVLQGLGAFRAPPGSSNTHSPRSSANK